MLKSSGAKSQTKELGIPNLVMCRRFAQVHSEGDTRENHKEPSKARRSELKPDDGQRTQNSNETSPDQCRKLYEFENVVHIHRHQIEKITS